jgi:uncharacterized repeat protein (TIGR02543 family)
VAFLWKASVFEVNPGLSVDSAGLRCNTETAKFPMKEDSMDIPKYKKQKGSSFSLVIFVILTFAGLGVSLSGCSALEPSTVTFYTTTYNGNGSTGGSVPVDSTSYKSGATVTVLGNTNALAKAGYTFSGWNTSSSGTGTSYSAGSTFTMGSADVVLYATWSAASTSVTAIVLDSLGGTPVQGAAVEVTDSSGNSVYTGTTGSSGSIVSSTLTSGSAYNITATDTGRAASEMLNYFAGTSSTVALYCHTIGISGVSATPPTVEYIKYSTDEGSTWTALANGATISGPFMIEASVLGVVAVKATSWSGFGIGIDIDQMPTATNGYSMSSSSLVSTKTDAALDSSTGEYRTVDLFDLSGLTFLPGSHTLDLVAYDVANNRVEERLSFSFQ